MPTASQHQNKAERNRKFVDSISIDDFPEWVVVAVFYTAVHIAERLRAAGGHGHSGSHEQRLTYIQRNHPDIHTNYHMLQNASLLARYQSSKEFFDQFQPEEITEKFVEGRLAPIEAYAAAHCPQ